MVRWMEQLKSNVRRGSITDEASCFPPFQRSRRQVHSLFLQHPQPGSGFRGALPRLIILTTSRSSNWLTPYGACPPHKDLLRLHIFWCSPISVTPPALSPAASYAVHSSKQWSVSSDNSTKPSEQAMCKTWPMLKSGLVFGNSTRHRIVWGSS